MYTFKGGNLKIIVYNNRFEEIDSGINLITPLLVDNTYYILYQNYSSRQTLLLTARQVSVSVISNNTLTSLGGTAQQVQYYKLNISDSSQYDLMFYGISGNQIVSAGLISNETIQPITYELTVGSRFTLYRTQMLNPGTYYLKLSFNDDTNIDFEYNPYQGRYKWVIDGKEYNLNDNITRGDTHTIELYDLNNKKVSDRFLTVGSDYVAVTTLVYENGSYKITIDSEAQLYKDTATVNPHLTLSLFEGKESGVSLCVIYQHEELNLVGYSLTSTDAKPKVKIDSSFLNKGEVANLYCKYSFDNGAFQYCTLQFKSSGSYIDLTNLTGFSQNYYNISFTIDYFDLIFSDGTTNTRVYNSENYPQYKNKIAIDQVVVGIHFESGIGTASDPFIIANAMQFNHMKYTINSNNEITSHFFIKGLNFTPYSIEMLNCAFQGVLDGNNILISCYSGTILSSGNIALFEEIGSKGVIKNLNLILDVPYDVGSNKRAATIAIRNKGAIQNSWVVPFLDYSACEYVVGIVAINEGIISNCTVNGYIKGGKYMGGIAGLNTGTILDCYSSSYMFYNMKYTDTDYIGGIVGNCQSGSILRCTFDGQIYE